jgi:glycerol kinase
VGAAWLAGCKAGLYPAQDAFAKTWALERHFEPQMSAADADERYAGWLDAVGRVLSRP